MSQADRRTADEAILRNWAGGASFYVTREAVQAVMGEYDRRGIVLANIGREEESSYQMGYRHGADETGEERLDEMRGELCRALGISEDTSWATAVVVAVSLLAARSTPEAPTAAERPADPTPACGCGGYTAGTIHMHACSCTPTMQDRGYRCDGCIADADDFAAVASPGADAPAEPTGAAALLALCDALDRLPASEGGSGPTLAVDEIRRLLGAPAGAGQLATKLRADTHQDRADRLAIALMRLRDVVDQLIREDREVENSNRCGESVEFDDGKGFTCALPNGHDGEHDVERRPGYLGASS